MEAEVLATLLMVLSSVFAPGGIGAAAAPPPSVAPAIAAVSADPPRAGRPSREAPSRILPTKPDLTVDRLWFAERPDGTGELPAHSPLMFQTQDYLVCDYSNIGTDATGQFLVGVFDDGAAIHKEWVAGLGSGTSRRVIVPFPAHAARGTVWCIVDWESKVEESDEDNNRKDRSYAPPHCDPDLMVDRALIEGRMPIVLGDTVRLVCEFSNQGGCLAGGLLGSFQVDGRTIGSFSRSALAPGQHDREVLRIQVGTARETKLGPELEPRPATGSGAATRVPAGGRVRSLRNRPTVIELEPGHHTFTCGVDVWQRAFDTDVDVQNNVSAAVAFEVTESSFNKPDFAVERIVFGGYSSPEPPDPAAIKAGSPFSLWCWYRNLGVSFGGYPEVRTAKIRMLIDGRTFVEAFVPEMLKGAGPHALVLQRDLFSTIGVGSHDCTCVADPEGVVPELAEGNNSATLRFTVIP